MDDAQDTLGPTARIARDLIRFDTTNWGGGRSNGEREAAEYLEAALSGLGLSTTVHESAERRTSVFTRVSGADPTKPALVVHGHTDVVPADPGNWSVDPFAGIVRDGMLWGRGAVDMKDMDAMILAVVRQMVREGRKPARTGRRCSPIRRSRRSSPARSWRSSRFRSRQLRRRPQPQSRARAFLPTLGRT